ncbi:MAG: DsbA family protein [Bacteroidota bacterium]
MDEKANKLIYVGDPMCSWCYGFGPELEKVIERFPQLDFQLILGGLRPQGTETMAKLGDFLREHWDHVKERSGQAFSYDILEQKDFVYDTEPACRAVETARTLKEDIGLDFYHAVQKAFYKDNKDTGKVETYLELAKEFELDTELFQKLFESEGMKENTLADFQLAANMGIRGFPSMVAQKEDQFYLLSRGYRTGEDMIKDLEGLYA